MTRKSIFMILAGFILMSGCTSYSGVGIADNGKPYYFDDKCVKYRWWQNRDDIQCLDSNGIVTGYRQPIPWEQYQQYLLLQQQRELEMYKLNLLNQSLNRTVNTNCFTTGGFTHCSTY